MNTQLTKEDVDRLIGFGNSHIQTPIIAGFPIGITKIQAFLSIRPLLTGANYWYALRMAYQGSDDFNIYYDDLRWAFNADQPNREKLMTPKERKVLAALPEQVTVYRGMRCSDVLAGNFGLSWSLDKAVAEAHAFKYQRNSRNKKGTTIAYELTVPKSQIIAYFNGRKEAEVIIANVKKINIIEI